MIQRRFATLCAALLGFVAWSGEAAAETNADRFGAGGYFRIMTRPDFQGGNSRLGFWNLYGRLLNEGPWASLELRLDILPQDPLTPSPWTSVHARIEGGSVFGADSGQGSLGNFALSQLYAQTGNVLLENVTWQIGTLESYWGDLGLYDIRLAQILFGAIGLSARYENQWVEVLLGVGDSGFYLKGFDYNTVLTTGGSVKLKLGKHAQVGVGAEYHYEPRVEGNRFAPHVSRFPGADATASLSDPGVDYEEFVRGEVVDTFFADGGQPQDFADPVAVDAALGERLLVVVEERRRARHRHHPSAREFSRGLPHRGRRAAHRVTGA